MANARTRVTIFDPVVIPDDVAALQIEKDVISDINTVIQYINNYPYIRVEYVQELMSELHTKISQSDEPDIEHAKRFLQYQGLINSVKKRSDFVLMLMNQQARLQELFEKHWHAKKDKCKEVTQKDIDNKKQEMQKLFAEFSEYNRFAHLTAEELAAVTLTIEALIVAIENSKAEIKNDQIKKIIEAKLQELIEAKTQIQRCMQQHLDIQVAAKKLRETNQSSTANSNNDMLDSGSTFNNSVFGGSMVAMSAEASADSNDILVPIKKKINELFGKEVLKIDDVPEDATLHLNISPIPFGNTRVPNLTVGGFFQERVASQSPQPQPKQERTSYLAKYLPNWSVPNVVNVSALSTSIGSWFKTLKDYVVDPVVNLVVVTTEQITYAAKSLKEKVLPSQPESLSYLDQIHDNARKEEAEFVKVDATKKPEVMDLAELDAHNKAKEEERLKLIRRLKKGKEKIDNNEIEKSINPDSFMVLSGVNSDISASSFVVLESDEEEEMKAQAAKNAELEKEYKILERKNLRLKALNDKYKEKTVVKQKSAHLENQLINPNVDVRTASKLSDLKMNERRLNAGIRGFRGANEVIEKENISLHRIHILKRTMAMMKYFVQQYQDRRTGGFFNHHGETGKARAAQFAAYWEQYVSDTQQSMINELMRMKSPEALDVKLKSQLGRIHFKFNELMNSDYLDGNYNRHSLKTYLLAAHDFILDLRREMTFERNIRSSKKLFNAYYVNEYENRKNYDCDETEHQYEAIRRVYRFNLAKEQHQNDGSVASLAK